MYAYVVIFLSCDECKTNSPAEENVYSALLFIVSLIQGRAQDMKVADIDLHMHNFISLKLVGWYFHKRKRTESYCVVHLIVIRRILGFALTFKTNV